MRDRVVSLVGVIAEVLIAVSAGAQSDPWSTVRVFPAGFAGLREYADSMWQEALNAFAAYVADQKRGAAKSGSHPAAKDKKGKIAHDKQVRLD
jgi:hypothetical protein